MKKNSAWSNLYITIIMLLLYLPILVVVLFSFNSNTGRTAAMSFQGFSTYWYKELFNPVTGYGAQLVSSLKVALWSVLAACVMGSLGAVAMVRQEAKKSLRQKALSSALNLGEQLAMLPMMIPELILGISLMALFNMLNIPFGMTTLILSHITFCVPYILVTVKSRLLTIDPSLLEAARDLGASPAKALLTVTLPLAAPAILSGALLAFAMSMDDFVISFFVSGAETTTLPLKIYSSVKVGVTPKVNAMCTVMLGAAFLFVGSGQLISAAADRKKEEGA